MGDAVPWEVHPLWDVLKAGAQMCCRTSAESLPLEVLAARRAAANGLTHISLPIPGACCRGAWAASTLVLVHQGFFGSDSVSWQVSVLSPDLCITQSWDKALEPQPGWSGQPLGVWQQCPHPMHVDGDAGGLTGGQGRPVFAVTSPVRVLCLQKAQKLLLKEARNIQTSW